MAKETIKLIAVTHERGEHIQKEFTVGVHETIAQQSAAARRALVGRNAEAIYSPDRLASPFGTYCPASCEYSTHYVADEEFAGVASC